MSLRLMHSTQPPAYRNSHGLRFAAVALALVACTPPASDDIVEDDTTTIPPPPYSEATRLPDFRTPSAGVPGEAASIERPATRRDVIMIEGMPDTVELRLVRAPANFPLRFSTYIPADMDIRTESTTDGHSLEFTARFGGVPNERAYLQFFFYPEGTTPALGHNSIEAFVNSLNPAVDRAREVEPHDWATEETAFTYPHEQGVFVGRIALAQRGDVVFHYVQHYPAEYADGMAPRIATILGEWRWGDGTALGTH